MHYIKNWDHTLSEFARILKPGGILLFSIHHPFMDFHHFKREDYFHKELVTDIWEKPNLTIKVQFYRRPLQEILNDTIKYFSIEKMIEPQQVEAFKVKNMEKYTYLMTNPHFLIVKARLEETF